MRACRQKINWISRLHLPSKYLEVVVGVSILQPAEQWNRFSRHNFCTNSINTDLYWKKLEIKKLIKA